PAEAAAMAAAPTGAEIASIDGKPVTSWTDVSQFLAQGASDTIRFAFDDGTTIAVPLHRDQLVERVELADALRPQHRAVIGDIVSGSAADEAGLAAGDSVLAVDGTAITWWTDFTAMVEPAGERELDVSLVRDG